MSVAASHPPAPQTAGFQKPKVVRFPITLREVTVTRVEETSPTLRRIYVSGPQLDAFEKDGLSLPAFASEGPDDHVKFFFPAPDGSLALPTQVEGHIDWPRNPRPIARDYTPRGYKAGDSEVAFEFVLHGHGTATRWAAEAKPGDVLHMAGPKASLHVNALRSVILIGDQTALPAICNWLDMLPEGAEAKVVISVEDAAAIIALPDRIVAEVEWVVETDPEAPELIAAVKRLEIGADTFVWGAMEAGAVKVLRAWFLTERGLPRERMDMTAYWRRGIDDDRIIEAAFALREKIDLLTPFAIRAAAGLNLPELVATGARSLEALAEKSGADPLLLAQVLPVLEASDVILRGDKGLTLGVAGELLTHPHYRAHGTLDAAPGRIDALWMGLPAALMPGRTGYEHAFGITLEADAARDPDFADDLAHEIEELAHEWSEALLARMTITHQDAVGVIGAEGFTLLRTLVAVKAGARGWAAVPAHALDHARAEHAEFPFADRIAPLAEDQPLPQARSYVLVAFGARWSDAAVAETLARLPLETGHEVLLVEMSRDPAPEPELAKALLRYSLIAGTRQGSDARITAALTSLGLTAGGFFETGVGLRFSRWTK